MKQPNSKKDYYVEYKNKEELADTMQYLEVKEPVEKYYNLNKFKYSHSCKDEDDSDEDK